MSKNQITAVSVDTSENNENKKEDWLSKSSIMSALSFKPKHKPPMPSNYVPPDGGWGWFCVFSCFLTFALLVGMSRTFGAIYNDVRIAFPESKHTEISLIPSVVSALTVGCGVFAGALSIAFSCRSVSFIGGFLSGLGICLCFFANSVLYMFFMFFIAGAGAGLACTPGLLIISKYFKKKRVMAIGFALAGTSVGTFLHPPLMRALTNEYGFRGALLIQGGILFHACAGALLYREPELPDINRKLSRPQHEASAPSVVHWGSAMTHVPHDDALSIQRRHALTKKQKKPYKSVLIPYMIRGGLIISPSLQARFTERRHLEWREGRYSLADKDKTNSCCCWVEEYLFIDLTLFYNPVFITVLFATMFIACSYPVSLFFIPPFAEEISFSREEAMFLLLVSGGGDLLGRLAFGWFFDQNFLSKHRGLVLCTVLSTASVVAIITYTNYIWICACVFIHAAFSGACYMLIPVLLSEYHGTSRIASSFGIVRSCQGLISMGTPVAVGHIKDKTGSFKFGLLFLGICMSLSTLFLLMVIPVKARYRKNMGENWPRPVPTDDK